MKKSLPWLTALLLLVSTTPFLHAQEDVARIAPRKKVDRVDKAIRNLQKRIQDGIDRKILTDAVVQALQKQVQDITDMEDQDFKANGAHVLTQNQLDQLHDRVLQASKAIRLAKQGR